MIGTYAKIAAGVILFAQVIHAQDDVPRQDTWVANDGILAVERTVDTIYLGGAFSEVGPYTGGFVSLEAAGIGDSDFVKVNGTVTCMAPDGFGGWYLGGDFTGVGGIPRRNLAHVLSDGTLDGGFTADTDAIVNAVALQGTTLYLGGEFTQIAGGARDYLATVDASTGNLLPWNPQPNFLVRALAADGTDIYAGGAFTSIAGQTRNRIAAFDGSSGSLLAWNPNANDIVDSIHVAVGTVYVGGRFTNVGSQVRNHIAALDRTSGNANAWNPNANARVQAFALSGGLVYAAGEFTSIGGSLRNRVAALDAATGMATAWDPNANGVVQAVALSGGTLYIAGRFTAVAGQGRHGLAAIDLSTGSSFGWNPNANDYALSVGVAAGKVFAGGAFHSVGGQPRKFLAALDAATGTVIPWAPVPNGSVLAIRAVGNSVFLGGTFTTVDGQGRNRIAEVSASTGAVTGWNPNASGAVDCIEVANSTVYIGGTFGTVSTQTRRNLAAIDRSTGSATAWNPDANGAVRALALLGNSVYAAGAFTAIGGQSRKYIAELSAATGAASAWDPNPNGMVNTIDIEGNIIYAGGSFTNIGGQIRNRLAAISTVTGAVTFWNPNANSTVNALQAVNELVFNAGPTSVGGESRGFLSAISANTGALTQWDPGLDDSPAELAATTKAMVAAGAFSRVGYGGPATLAEFDLNPPSVESIIPSTLGPTEDDSVTFTVTFDEAVRGFDDAADLLVHHSGTSHLSTTIGGGPRIYQVTLGGITGNGSFTVEVNIESDVVDVVDKSLASSLVSGAVVIQHVGPAVAIGAPLGSPVNSAGTAQFPVSVFGAVSVHLFPADVTIHHNGTSGGSVSVVDGTSSTPTVEITGVLGDGSYTISIAAGIAADGLGNPSAAVGPSAGTVVVDNTSPDVVLSTTALDPVGGPFLVTAQVSEAVTGFDLSDLLPVNGVSGGFSGSGDFYQFNLVPTASPCSVSVPASRLVDAAGNLNNPSNALSRDFDGTLPAVLEISPSTTGPTNADTVSFTVVFDGPVVGFNTTTDVVIQANGVVTSDVSISGGPVSYAVDVQGIGGDGSFTLSVSTQSNVTDMSSRPLSASITSVPVLIDNTAPVVTLTSNAPNPVGGPVVIRAVLGQVGVLTAGDIATVNASVISFTGGGTTYFFTLKPDVDGLFSARVGAGAFADVAGNGNTASNILTRTFDTTPPTVGNIVAVPEAAALGEAVEIFFSAGESLAAEAEVTVNGHPATRQAQSAFAFDYVIRADDPLGPATIVVQAVDHLGNVGVATSHDALRVLAPGTRLPLLAWPAGLAILAAALAGLRRRAR